MREKNSAEMTSLPDRLTSSNFAILNHLLPLLEPYRGKFLIAFYSLVLTTLSTLGIGYFLREIVDTLTLDDTSFFLALQQGSFGEIWHEPLIFNSILLSITFCILALSSFGRSYYVSWLGERLTTDLRQKIFAHLMELDVGFFDMNRAGELLSRLTTDTTLIQIVVGTSVAIALRNLLLLVGGLAMMFLTSIKLTLICLLVVPLILLPLILLGRRVKTKSRKTQDALGDLSGYLEEVLSSIRTCYAFNRESAENNRFYEESEKGFNISVERIFLKSCLSSLVMILVFVAIVSVIWLGSYPDVSGDISAGQLTSFIFYALMVAGTLGSFSEIFADLHRAAGAAERLFEILNTPIQRKELHKQRFLPTSVRGVVAFHNISFAYAHNPKHQILKNVTFSIAPGENIAIVGPSGAGKSTILSLLLRLFDPQSGTIYIDGINSQEIRLSELRAYFGIVPQDPMIFSGTLYDNILYGACSPATSEDVWKAAESAHLLDLIKTLPQGIHTPVGARGVRLSGGQKQRIAIARIILRDPAILLLDEATSALDAQSEKAIQDSLKKLMSTRTTLVVAHRLSTVLKADNIIVLNNGQVEATGTHAELISKDGLYRRLATLQFIDSIQRPTEREKEQYFARA